MTCASAGRVDAPEAGLAEPPFDQLGVEPVHLAAHVLEVEGRTVGHYRPVEAGGPGRHPSNPGSRMRSFARFSGASGPITGRSSGNRVASIHSTWPPM